MDRLLEKWRVAMAVQKLNIKDVAALSNKDYEWTKRLFRGEIKHPKITDLKDISVTLNEKELTY